LVKWHYGKLARNEWGIDSDQSSGTRKYPENEQLLRNIHQNTCTYLQILLLETYYLCGFPRTTRYDSQH